MGKLSVFNFVTLNGYFKGENEDVSWHPHDSDSSDYAAEKSQSESILLFGRVTFEMMVSYWPTQMAMENDPEVAKGMNGSEKIVFSGTLKKDDPRITGWKNTRLISENIVEEIRKLKKSSGKDLTLLGSGSIIIQFADAGLIDQYQFMIDPVLIGFGTPILKDMKQPQNLKLTDCRKFNSGIVVLTYVPV